MTTKQAYYWVIRKWNYIVKNNGIEDIGLFVKYPKLRDFESSCAYCQLFIYSPGNCKGCPLKPEKGTGLTGCWESNHPWFNWYRHQTKENAEAVRNLIIKTRPK